MSNTSYVATISKATRKRLNSIINEKTRPHEKTDDNVINEGLDALENKYQSRIEEIEEGELVLSFPKPTT